MLAFIICSSLIIQSSAAELQYRFTDQIVNTESHEYCEVHQTTELTLLSCPGGFEVYKTQDLVSQPYYLSNDGESRPIRYIRHSLEPGRESQLTYVQNGNQVWTIYHDADFGSGFNQVVKYKIMTVDLPTGIFIEDCWVLEKVVAIRVTGGEFAFYEKPLVQGNMQVNLTFDQSMHNVTNISLVQEFMSIDGNKFAMFAVSGWSLIKYQMEYVPESDSVRVTSVQT